MIKEWTSYKEIKNDLNNLSKYLGLPKEEVEGIRGIRFYDGYKCMILDNNRRVIKKEDFVEGHVCCLIPRDKRPTVDWVDMSLDPNEIQEGGGKYIEGIKNDDNEKFKKIKNIYSEIKFSDGSVKIYGKDIKRPKEVDIIGNEEKSFIKISQYWGTWGELNIQIDRPIDSLIINGVIEKLNIYAEKPVGEVKFWREGLKEAKIKIGGKVENVEFSDKITHNWFTFEPEKYFDVDIKAPPETNVYLNRYTDAINKYGLLCSKLAKSIPIVGEYEDSHARINLIPLKDYEEKKLKGKINSNIKFAQEAIELVKNGIPRETIKKFI